MLSTTLNRNKNGDSHRQPKLLVRLAGVLALGVLAVIVSSLQLRPAGAQDREPIAISGHGGFFDHDGRQIPLTLSFAAKAQEWYRNKLMSELPAAKKRAFAAYERRLMVGLSGDPQEKLIVQHQSLEWLIANTESTQLKVRTAGKLRALRYAMNWKLPERADLRIVQDMEPYVIRPEVMRRLESMQFRPVDNAHAPTATNNSGQAYINECIAAGVPIPPTINVMDTNGLTGWKSQGFIPPASQFIVGTPAEVRTWRSNSPVGMCYSLPRYTGNSLSTIMLDGVICMGQQSSKVCFWDNQWTTMGMVQAFSIPAGSPVPIGVPSSPGGKYQGGGKEIEFGPGDVCTDCHAGENPYIIHPDVNLGTVTWGTLSGPPQNLPSIPINRYDPLVGASWPQNALSHSFATVPTTCRACHVKNPSGPGRFPHLSNQIKAGYCSTILAQAITKTMPPGSPGSAATEANAWRNAYCNDDPDLSAADAGDPHITTTNGINYDFQAAGEFTALKTDETFELQTRQSPVITTFIPGANPYTGLQSCVSLNTAVALRVGKCRVTYQPSGGGLTNAERLVLRVNGERVEPGRRYEFCGGNVINKTTATGELLIRLTDGTRIVVTPLFWSSQGYWYMDVQVFDTPAREGVMGHILAGDFLPRAPDGSSFGPKPVSLLDRHQLLNHKFADAWRVTSTTSLFDYPAGTSTTNFTDRDWPSPPGGPCSSTTYGGPTPKVREPRPDLAKRACRGIKDEAIYNNCIFDVTVMGDPIAAVGHKRADQLKALANP